MVRKNKKSNVNNEITEEALISPLENENIDNKEEIENDIKENIIEEQIELNEKQGIKEILQKKKELSKKQQEHLKHSREMRVKREKEKNWKDIQTTKRSQ